ncbi:hypothetical protein NDU88_000976 [Pleurodeles waltl]|uniref:Uncharacterized protein n=1 Tax=Pleurodeles waltl TaxID=8319 RepID=A0AAV7MLA7_PLEWA|nr:hypothetical protein NDU88_000976 [Pleurodeles waltl]
MQGSGVTERRSYRRAAWRGLIVVGDGLTTSNTSTNITSSDMDAIAKRYCGAALSWFEPPRFVVSDYQTPLLHTQFELQRNGEGV